MFSLIITIISIALVAALALATLYYGGGAFNKSAASADATKLTNQATQLQGAAELYRADRGAYPATMADLVTHNYLKSIPVAQASPLLSQALAQGATWTMVLEGYPVFALSPVSLATCQGVNLMAYGEVGVLKAARQSLGTQCYGADANNLTVVSAKTGAMLELAATSPLASRSLGAVSTAPVPALDSLDSSINGWLGVDAPAQPPVTPLPVVAFENAGAEPLGALNFAPTRMGESSAAQTLVIRNTGTANLTFTAPGVQVATPFTLTFNTCSAATVIPGEACQVGVSFSPLAIAAYVGEQFALSVQSNAVQPGSVPLSGTGLAAAQAQASLSTSFLNFGSVATHTSLTRQVVLTNTGEAALALTAAPTVSGNGAFGAGLSTCGASLGVGQYCLTDATFAPTSTGSFTGKLSFASALVGSPHEVTLSAVAFNPVSLASATLPQATKGQVYAPYSLTSLLNVSNEQSPNLGAVAWASPAGLPAGLSVNASTGVLSGTPSAANAGADFTVTATYKNNLGQQVYTLVVQDVVLSGVLQMAQGSSSSDHTCTFVTGGAAKCWGANSFGQLGDGTVTQRLTPVPVLGGGVTALTTSHGYSCAIQNGAAWCWGVNANGQLGDGTVTQRLSPVQVPGLASGVTSIDAGTSHSCAIRNGAAWCWGANSFGQLGDGTVTQRLSPVQVTGLASGVTSIDVSNTHSCAVQNGAAKCWGMNAFGQLGNNSLLAESAPVPVIGLESGVTAIVAGGITSCAIHNDALKCWGRNTSGGLGDGSATTRQTPVQVLGLTSGVTSVGVYTFHTCAVHAGVAKCWGRNTAGQVGDGTTVQRLGPVAVAM